MRRDLRADSVCDCELHTSPTIPGTFGRSYGGKAANEAVALSRLGVGTALVGVVGRDEDVQTTQVRRNASIRERCVLSQVSRRVHGRHIECTSSVASSRESRRAQLLDDLKHKEGIDVSGVRRQAGVDTGQAVQISLPQGRPMGFKLTVTCGQANHEFSDTEVAVAKGLLNGRSSVPQPGGVCTEPLLLLQFEVHDDEMCLRYNEMCKHARALGRPVAFMASPLADETQRDGAADLIAHGVSLCLTLRLRDPDCVPVGGGNTIRYDARLMALLRRSCSADAIVREHQS